MARRTSIKGKAGALCHSVLNPKSPETRWAPKGAVTTGFATARNYGTRCLRRRRRHARPAGAWATWVRGVYGVSDSLMSMAFISKGEVHCTAGRLLTECSRKTVRCEGFGRGRISEQPMCRSSDSSSDAIFARRWVVAECLCRRGGSIISIACQGAVQTRAVETGSRRAEI